MQKKLALVALLALEFTSMGCVKRAYNQNNGGVKSTNSGAGAKTFKCSATAYILPENGPKGRADFGELKIAIDESAQPAQIKIEKKGSFKQWGGSELRKNQGF